VIHIKNQMLNYVKEWTMQQVHKGTLVSLSVTPCNAGGVLSVANAAEGLLGLFKAAKSIAISSHLGITIKPFDCAHCLSGLQQEQASSQSWHQPQAQMNSSSGNMLQPQGLSYGIHCLVLFESASQSCPLPGWPLRLT
jgi:hypothetical protein